jgi:hypothetical protein
VCVTVCCVRVCVCALRVFPRIRVACGKRFGPLRATAQHAGGLPQAFLSSCCKLNHCGQQPRRPWGCLPVLRLRTGR